MPNRKLLVKISFVLLIVNFLFGLFVVYNGWNNKELVQEQAESTEKVLGAESVPLFSPNYVMSNETFRSTRAFPSENSVQTYLESINSPLKNYSAEGRRASYWIYGAARGTTSSRYGITPQINPGVILAYLEKEQSLLSLKDYNTQIDQANRIKTAMGYGCPDGSSCNPAYTGFVNQLNWAAYQLEYNYRLATSSTPDSYKINNTITTLDGYNVFLSNAATASSYRYTPHVFFGNYNLWKILTANGWGISSKTYNMAEIDSVNLPRAQDLKQAEKPNIKQAEIQSLLDSDITIGTQGEDIRKLQMFLSQSGCFTYPAFTGYYGSVTDRAKQCFLSGQKPPVEDNQISEQCRNLFAIDWQIGDSGEQVKQTQTCLRDLNLYAYHTITGNIGDITMQGLRTIRSRLDITPGKTSPVQDSENTEKTETSENNTDTSLRFTTNSRDSGVSGLNIRQDPAGKKTGVVPWNISGSSLEGPIDAKLNGVNHTWYKVKFDNGQTGWVAKAYLDEGETGASNNSQSSTQKRFTTNSRGSGVSGLNIRQDPAGKKTGVVPWNISGSSLEGPIDAKLNGVNHTWYKVKFDNGQTGWVAKAYLDEN